MQCERAGFIKLFHGGHEHVVRTVCKTWRCRSCRPKVLSLVSMRMNYGLLTLGRSYFITLTYHAPLGFSPRTAECVRKDLQRFWYRLRKCRGLSDVAWFKVPELTKRGQIHLHHLVGGPTTARKATCRSPQERYRAWMKRTCKVDCLEHQISSLWQGVTSDSFVVDVSVVRDPARCAGYLAKYLSKGFRDRETLEALGFSRRWSCSRGWPGGSKLHYRGTDEGWSGVILVPWHYASRPDGRLDERATETEQSDCAYLETVGTDLALMLRAEKARYRHLAIIRGVQNADR